MAKLTLSVPLATSLSPLAHGVLSALSEREDPAHAEANSLITSMLLERLEQIAPGAWDQLIYTSKQPGVASLEPRQQSTYLAGELGRILRARAAR